MWRDPVFQEYTILLIPKTMCFAKLVVPKEQFSDAYRKTMAVVNVAKILFESNPPDNLGLVIMIALFF